MAYNIKEYPPSPYNFDNEKVYTERQLSEMVDRLKREFVINRVIQKGKDCDIALQILEVHKTPEGYVVIVK